MITKDNFLDYFAAASIKNLDTGETFLLRTKDSICHFLDQSFTFEHYEVTFRLDWGQRDKSDNPTLDADFVNLRTGKSVKLRKKRDCKQAHHTYSQTDHRGRVYEWQFKEHGLYLQLSIVWKASGSAKASAHATASCGIIKSLKPKSSGSECSKSEHS